MNTVIVVFRKGNTEFSFQIRLGLVNRVGITTPRRYLGRELKEVGNILISKGFKLKKIL